MYVPNTWHWQEVKNQKSSRSKKSYTKPSHILMAVKALIPGHAAKFNIFLIFAGYTTLSAK